MNNNDRIHEIDMFNLIFIIAIVVSAVTIYTNNIQKKDLINDNCEHFEQLKKIRLFLNTITAISFIYILYVSYKNLTLNSNNKGELESNFYNFIASLLFLTGTLFNISSIYKRQNEKAIDFVF